MAKIEIKKLTYKEKIKWEKYLGKSHRINRKDYDVIYCAYLQIDDKQVAGLCSSNDKKIYVDVTLGDVESTLIHEIIHGEFAESGIRQRSDWTIDLEEVVCEMIAESMTTSFKLRAKNT